MNDNKQYTLEELVDNSEFISWVKNGMIASSPWSIYGDGKDDQMAIKQKAIELIEYIQFSDDDEETQNQKEKIWSSINQSLDFDHKSKTQNVTPIKTQNKSKIRPLYWIGAAAAACLLFLFMFRLGDSSESIMTIYADNEIVSHTLPDQSRIDVTPGSTINYNKEKWETNRVISLKGEAFFDVEKGETFKVITDNATVTVLGTSFNIKESDLNTEVICLTGKVKVRSTQSNQEQIIIANQSAVVEKDSVEKQVHSKIYIPWKEDQYSFTKTELKDIMIEIQQSYGVNITIDDNAGGEEFTGSFEKSSLQTVLHNICWPMNLDFKIDGDEVSITKAE